MLPESTDLETRKYPEYPKLPPSSRVLELSSAGTEVSSPTSLGESTGQDESGSLQPSGSSQATTQNPTQIENDPPHSDKQAVQSSRHSSRSRSRGETLQSEPQTPLPIDPAQVDLSQLRNPAYSHPGWTRKSDTNLRTTPGKDHRVDDAQDNVGVNPNSESGNPSSMSLHPIVVLELTAFSHRCAPAGESLHKQPRKSSSVPGEPGGDGVGPKGSSTLRIQG